MQILLSPFVWILQLFYNLFQNYGLALFFFAFLVKLILFPASIKGKRGMIQMNMLNGQVQKLQKMYGNNKERYNLEVQKLYEKEKVSPMGGCLWSFVPILILFPLYEIVRRPLTYMMGLSAEAISAVAEKAGWAAAAAANGWAASFTGGGYEELYLASLITPDKVSGLQSAVSGAEGLFSINFNFLGINLAAVPKLEFWTIAGGLGLFLLPVISAVTGLLFSLISTKTNAINQQSQQNNPTNKTMLIISPLMSLWIGFIMPAALCVYWIAQNLFSMLQEFVASKLLKKDYEKAAAEAARREAEEKEEEKRLKEEKRLERERRIQEEKENKGKKKPQKKEEGPSGPDKEASRVGIRAYARGRAYNPYRFSKDGPTPYPFGESTVKLTPPAEEICPAQPEGEEETGREDGQD